MNAGIIGIHKHRVECVIGIYAAEREQPQTVYVDVKIKIDFSASLKSGKIEDSVDYVSIARACTELAENNQYQLLETFAADILTHCMRNFKASWAWVHIQKPSAIPTAAYAFVEMEIDQKERQVCGHS